ncbi:sodium:proton antiporter [Bifidobacterium aemilianum]|uniref:Na(+)/H(+) antiporter NhaA n=1 Tax=Bifidobacterium aemilianum TaxID=2493120 RepID=A0A366K700_9BIFI|nr:Na+/H+ antiporter NhaA [Bifidobacterium aemilianum]RBP97516.1 sodium:proton antiporter [Bifidobacterium aemilianum]
MPTPETRDTKRLHQGIHNLAAWLVAFSRSGSASGMLMLVLAAFGLLCANMVGADRVYDGFSRWVPLRGGLLGSGMGLDLSIKEWVQDGLLTIFFLVMGLDLCQEMETGTLRTPKQALLPMIAAMGGVLLPIGIYLAICQGSPSSLQGWAVPTATDVAFSLTALKLLSKHGSQGTQAFLTTLAVFDDIIGVILIAVGYSSLSHPLALIPVAGCLVLWFLLMRARHPVWPLACLLALGAWYGLYVTGIHPVLAGVALGLLTPGHPVHGGVRSRAACLNMSLAPISNLLVLPAFAFLSMGISLHGFSPAWLSNPVFLGIMAGLAVGKPLGIMAMLLACAAVGLRLPLGTRWGDMVQVSQLCGIGFTMSFLIANIAFADGQLTSMALVAVLAGSLLSFALAAITGLILKVARRPRP